MLQSSRALSLIMSLCLLAFSSPKLLAQAKLSQTEAILRATQVSEVRYGLTMDLTRGDKEFQGEVVIDFNWKASSEPLRIDFNRGEIKTILLNGQSVKFAYNMIAATIKPELLKVGANKMTIAFKHLYSKDGNGLYRFVDPEDKRVYLYSNFEPYDANQMFPSFDQPDLKA
ncbi:MAG: aminopeptidase N, partial [Proteobacteria bacterium]